MTINDLNMQIIRCENFHGDVRWNYHDVIYPYNTLYFIIGGDGWIASKKQTLPLVAGHAYLIPAHQSFCCWCETEVHKVYADVNVEIVPGYDIFSRIEQIRELTYETAEISRMRIACERQSFKDMVYLKGRLWAVLAELIDDSFTILNGEIMSFKPILDDVQKQLSIQLRVSDIALRHGVPPAVLSRKFKQVFGCGIKAYIERLIVHQIQLQLIYNNCSMKELAEQYGFCDQFYFSSFFKKHTALSPTAYRTKMMRTLD